MPHQFEPVEGLANFREIVGISNATFRIRQSQARVAAQEDGPYHARIRPPP